MNPTNPALQPAVNTQPEMSEEIPELTLMGKLLNGFLIHEEIGRGGMAIVYRATQPTLNRSVALKVLHPDFVQLRPDFITRFQQEAEAIARLSHPYILPVYDYGEADGHYYIAMQYVPNGLTLRSYMSSEQVSDAADNTLSQMVTWIIQIADALSHAHQNNVIHCDLKPSNILVHDGRPLLADFGLAILDQREQRDTSAELMGTPAYMAPEQLLFQPVDERTDVYALGLIFYQLLTAILPHNAASPEEITAQRITLPQPPSLFRPELPAIIDQITLKALAVSPSDRYQQMADFGAALAALELSERQPVEPPALPVESPIPDEATILSPPSLTPFQAPVEPPHFVDRETCRTQIQQIVATKAGNHLFGLVGLGGSGKTALATQLVYELREHFPDGILWAQLDVTTPSAALVSFGNSFGQRERVAEEPDLATKAMAVRQILANKRVLMVLDNVEESGYLEHLIPTGPNNVALITTRNRKLLTTIAANVIDVDPLDAADCIDLLEKIVGAKRVQAELDAANQVVALVGGLPLALDIVAGYLVEAEDLTIAEYKNALQDERLRLESLADWEDASKDVVASFELSYRKLPPQLQEMFAALSIFCGQDFSTDAVSNVTKLPLPAVKSALGRMRSLSLLTSHSPDEERRDRYGPTQKQTTARYGLHPLLRLFAQTKLSDGSSSLSPFELNQRAADYFAQLAQEQAQEAYTLLAQERENILGALQWAAQNQQWAPFYQGVLGLTEPYIGVMGMFDAHGHWGDARQLLEQALSSMSDATDGAINLAIDLATRAKLTIRAGVFAQRERDYETSEKHLQEALDQLDTLFNTLSANAKSTGDKSTSDKFIIVDLARNATYLYDSMAQIFGRRDREEACKWLTSGIQALHEADSDELLAEMGYLHIKFSSVLGLMRRLDEAYDAATKGLALLPPDPNPAQIAGLINLANIASYRGNTEQCVAYIQEGILLAERFGEHRRLALLWMNLAAEHEQVGEYKRARDCYQTSLQFYQQMGHENEGYIHSNLGFTHTILGEDELAFEHLTKAIELAKSADMLELRAYALTNLARLQLYRSEVEPAQTNLTSAHEICQQLQLSHPTITVLRLLAEVAQISMNDDAAFAYIEESIHAAVEITDDLNAGISWRVKGNILRGQAALEAAQNAYEMSLALIAQTDPYERARTQTELARCLLHPTLLATLHAKPLLEEALITFERLDTRWEMTYAEALLSQIE